MHPLKVINITLFIIIIVLCKYFEAKCPDPHLLYPCICQPSRSVLTCQDLDNEEMLKSVVEVSKGEGIVGVELVSVAIRYIPEDAFQGLNIKFLTIQNSSILALSDTDRAFSGLENSLLALEVSDCHFANAWEWTQLTNLTKMQKLEVSESELLDIGPDFLSLSKLPITTVKFLDTRLHSIPNNIFSSFKDLDKVSLEKNELTEIQRSMFPKPAKKLTSLGLSHNRILSLPNDIFVGMPALKYLYIGANPLYILDEKLFKPVWSQLSMFVFHDTPLVCDCRLTWLTKTKHNNKFIHATCANPLRLKGRKITTLEKNELWCSFHSREPEIEIYDRK